jgi:hypothetical protein
MQFIPTLLLLKQISLIAVTLMTAVVCAQWTVRGDLKLAATKGKRHISPVHLQPYAGSLLYHRPSVLDGIDYFGESDKGHGGK